jgi:hypothetical protein
MSRVAAFAMVLAAAVPFLIAAVARRVVARDAATAPLPATARAG